MARHRRTGSRNWARGLFATFWILLGGLSGAYLFTAFTNPSALGGQLVALNAGGGATPASDGTTAAIGTEPPQTSEQEIAEINERLRQLTEQMAALNTRFKSAENAPGPVAALAPATSVTAPTSDAQPAAPAIETKPPEAAAAPPPPPPAEPPAEEVKPAPAEEPKPAEAPKGRAEAGPASRDRARRGGQAGACSRQLSSEPPPVAVSTPRRRRAGRMQPCPPPTCRRRAAGCGSGNARFGNARSGATGGHRERRIGSGRAAARRQ